jgi:hypothetical protein
MILIAATASEEEKDTTHDELHHMVSRVTDLVNRYKAGETERQELLKGAVSIGEASAKAQAALQAMQAEANEMTNYGLEVSEVDAMISKRFEEFASQRRGIAKLLRKVDFKAGDGGVAQLEAALKEAAAEQREQDLKAGAAAAAAVAAAANSPGGRARSGTAGAGFGSRGGAPATAAAAASAAAATEDVFLTHQLLALASRLRSAVQDKDSELEVAYNLLKNMETKMKLQRTDLLHEITRAQEKAFIANSGIRADDDNVRYLRRIAVAKQAQYVAERNLAAIQLSARTAEMKLQRVVDSWSKAKIAFFDVVQGLNNHTLEPNTPAHLEYEAAFESLSSTIDHASGGVVLGIQKRTKAVDVAGLLDESRRQGYSRIAGPRKRMAAVQTERAHMWKEPPVVRKAECAAQTDASPSEPHPIVPQGVSDALAGALLNVTVGPGAAAAAPSEPEEAEPQLPEELVAKAARADELEVQLEAERLARENLEVELVQTRGQRAAEVAALRAELEAERSKLALALVTPPPPPLQAQQPQQPQQQPQQQQVAVNVVQPPQVPSVLRVAGPDPFPKRTEIRAQPLVATERRDRAEDAVKGIQLGPTPPPGPPKVEQMTSAAAAIPSTPSPRPSSAPVKRPTSGGAGGRPSSGLVQRAHLTGTGVTVASYAAPVLPQTVSAEALKATMYRFLKTERALVRRGALENWCMLLRKAMVSRVQSETVAMAQEQGNPAILKVFDYANAGRQQVDRVFAVRRKAILEMRHANLMRAMEVAADLANAGSAPGALRDPGAGPSPRPPRPLSPQVSNLDRMALPSYPTASFPLPLHVFSRMRKTRGMAAPLSQEERERAAEASGVIDWRFNHIAPSSRKQVIEDLYSYISTGERVATIEAAERLIASEAPPFPPESQLGRDGRPGDEPVHPVLQTSSGATARMIRRGSTYVVSRNPVPRKPAPGQIAPVLPQTLPSIATSGTRATGVAAAAAFTAIKQGMAEFGVNLDDDEEDADGNAGGAGEDRSADDTSTTVSDENPTKKPAEAPLYKRVSWGLRNKAQLPSSK